MDLVGGWAYPSEKYEFVTWDDEIPNIWKNVKFMFQSTPTRNKIRKTRLGKPWWLSGLQRAPALHQQGAGIQKQHLRGAILIHRLSLDYPYFSEGLKPPTRYCIPVMWRFTDATGQSPTGLDGELQRSTPVDFPWNHSLEKCWNDQDFCPCLLFIHMFAN